MTPSHWPRKLTAKLSKLATPAIPLLALLAGGRAPAAALYQDGAGSRAQTAGRQRHSRRG